jgi:DNA polymerase
MKDVYHLDIETYSSADLRLYGAFRYGSDESTELLVLAIARNEEAPVAWDALNGGEEALAMFKEAIDTGSIIWAHNSQFESAVLRYVCHKTFGFDPPAIEQWRCTQAQCKLAAIPSSLLKAGDFLGIESPKDKNGKRLIMKFSVPRRRTKANPSTRILPSDDPVDFQMFVDYCIRDVKAERQIGAKLSVNFPLEGWALTSFLCDARMNHAGIPVNLTALRHANKLMDEFLERMVPLFRSQVAVEGGTQMMPVTKVRKEAKEMSLDDGFNPTQREAFVVWLQARGFTGTKLDADSVAELLANTEGLTDEAVKALDTYGLVNSAAVKKVPAMIEMSCQDGFVRGALNIFGAERTHRWTGAGIQPQNFARPRLKFTELSYSLICGGATLDEIESICGNYFDVLVSVLRHFIQPHEREVLQADYSSIEARVAPWLVGEQSTLDLFINNSPVYETMASQIFGIPVKDVTSEQRFIGKQATLGCSYQMGAPRFRGTCESFNWEPSSAMVHEYTGVNEGDEGYAEALDFTFDDLAQRAVDGWRKANPIMVKAWRGIDKAAKSAIKSPGVVFTVGKLKFKVRQVSGFQALLVLLPSGHKLVYPKPRIVDDSIEFWGVQPNTGGKWGTCRTYGGKLFENATQATAGDVMRAGMEHAEAEGYKAFMLVHDELLTIKHSGQTHTHLCELLCKELPWMAGMPLDAEGATIPFYLK